MKISIFFSYHSSFSHKYSGAVTRWVFEVLSRLENHENFTFEVLHPKQNSLKLFEFRKLTVRQVPSYANWIKVKLPLPRRLKEKLSSYFWCKSVMSQLNEEGLVLIQNRLHYALILRKLGYQGQIYVHLHNELFRHSSVQYLQKLDKAIDGLFSCCDAVLAPLKTKCLSLHNKGVTIYNGVNTSFFYPRPSLKKDNVILFVGRIVEQKGIHLLLEVYSRLLSTFPTLQLKLAGSATFGGERPLTSYEKKIKSTVENINRRGGKVELLGFVEHDVELPKLYAEATVLCMSSQYTEAFPMVIVEAMFCGTVVVAPRLGGIPEALPSESLIYPEGDVDEMYNRLAYVLKNKPARKKIEEENLSYAQKNFTWDIIKNRFTEILETVT